MKVSDSLLTQWTAELALIAYIALVLVAATILITS